MKDPHKSFLKMHANVELWNVAAMKYKTIHRCKLLFKAKTFHYKISIAMFYRFCYAQGNYKFSQSQNELTSSSPGKPAQQ